MMADSQITKLAIIELLLLNYSIRVDGKMSVTQVMFS